MKNNVLKVLCLLCSTAMALSILGGCSSDNKAKPAPVAKLDSAPKLDGYSLLWNDEFDGKKLNMDLWNYEPHEPGWTNKELQEYTKSTDNVYLKNGSLVIKAIKTKALSTLRVFSLNNF